MTPDDSPTRSACTFNKKRLFAHQGTPELKIL